MKKLFRKKYFTAIFILLIFSAAAVGGILFWKSKKSDAVIDYGGVNANLRGFAWSENAGWISFNAKDCDTNANGFIDSGNCGGSDNASTPIFNYGVTVATSTSAKGYVYGYAWSPNFGWISFNRKTCSTGADRGKFCVQASDCADASLCEAILANGATGNPPADPFMDASLPYSAFYTATSTQLRGWAKVLSLGDNGWLRMEDTNGISANGLVFYQSFNYADTDWSAKKAFDRSGVTPANDLSLSGGTGISKPAKGKIGWGLELDGSNWGVKTSPTSLPTGNSPFTISAWVNFSSAPDMAIIAGWGPTATRQANWFCIIGGKMYHINYSNSGDSAANTTLSTNTWHNILITYDGTTRRYYLNGSPDGSNTPQTMNITGSDLSVAYDINGNDSHYNGKIDEVRIYNRALSDNEITRLYQNGVYLDNSGNFNGWAWNGNSTAGVGMGWVSLNSSDCDADGNGKVDVSCGSDNLSKDVFGYKVYTEDPYVLNSPPLAIDLTAPNWTYTQACDYGALNAQLQWEFFDLDNTTQTAYEIVITQDNNILPDPSNPDSISDGAGSNFPLNTDKRTTGGGANSFWPQNNSYRNAALSYNKKYYWWVRVWDNLDEPSKWIQYNTSTDNPAIADNSDPLSFTTYKHEFPDPYFKWFPLMPSKDESTIFTDFSDYYDNSNTKYKCFNSSTGSNACTFNWSPDGSGITISYLPYGLPPNASSTIITFTEAKITGKKITLTVTDPGPENYSCSTSTTFKANVKLPIWREVK